MTESKLKEIEEAAKKASTCAFYDDEADESTFITEIPSQTILDLIAENRKMREALQQCRIYSECYDELIMTIDEALKGSNET